MKRNLLFVGLFAMLATTGMAQEAAEVTSSLADVTSSLPAVPGLNGEALEGWFFSFLEKLLNLFANFIGQILGDIFGGIGGMFSGPAA